MHFAWYLKKNAVLLCQWQWFSVVYHLACMRNLKMSVKLWVNFKFSQYMLIVLLSLNMSQKKRKMKHTFCAGGSRWRLPLCEESDGCWTLMTVGKRLPSVLHYCRQSRLETHVDVFYIHHIYHLVLWTMQQPVTVSCHFPAMPRERGKLGSEDNTLIQLFILCFNMIFSYQW